MNLVKFKDVILDEFFNTHFKGKYAYLCRMKYAFTFDMTSAEYTAVEQSTGTPTIEKPYINIEDYSEAIDQEITDQINDISIYKYKNGVQIDSDISLEDLKKFRSWLASELLKIYEYKDDVKNMLNYYAQGKYDDTIKVLSLYPISTQISQNVISGCSCCNGTWPSTTPNSLTISSCDPVISYRTSVYNCMVNTFSQLEFWTKYPTEFINKFYKYIDNILKSGLYLGGTTYASDFKSCECVNTNSHILNIEYLKSLRQALKYIMDDDVTGHKLFINSAFENWAKYVYEIMEW